jgi:hypothetical protein
MMVGVAAHAVSAARIAIRILRENIFSGERSEPERMRAAEWHLMARRVPRHSFAWNIPAGCDFPVETEHPTAREDEMAERAAQLLREGIITGFIGATAIAVWFLIVDTISGHPFLHPDLSRQGRRQHPRQEHDG